MKKLHLSFCPFLIPLLVACQSTSEPAPSAPPDLDGSSVATPSAADESYPSPTEAPAAPGSDRPSDYPGPPTPPPTRDPYPGNAVWIVHPAGEQCAEGLMFPDLASATSSLEDAGVSVLASEEVNLMVCQACGCPTSEHYRVQIPADDLGQANGLGWQQE